MTKLPTPVPEMKHPAWCDRPFEDHDPHTSVLERVAEDFPSDLVIDAYLLQLHRSPDALHPGSPLAALEFRYPGEETASYLLTVGQLRRLEAALDRLATLVE